MALLPFRKIYWGIGPAVMRVLHLLSSFHQTGKKEKQMGPEKNSVPEYPVTQMNAAHKATLRQHEVTAPLCGAA
jgi:hypothetical protein